MSEENNISVADGETPERPPYNISEVNDKITRARTQLLTTAPFFGILATLHLKLVAIEDERFCMRAGTDGRHMYYNPAYINQLDLDGLKYTLGHLIFHCCYEHMHRRGNRDPEMFGYAADMVTNLELSSQRLGSIVNMPDHEHYPTVAVYDTKYMGMCTDEVYELIKQDTLEGNPPEMPEFDDHFDPSELVSQEALDAGIVQMSRDDVAESRGEFISNMINAAKSAGSSSIPSSIRSMVDELLEPTMDWRAHLLTLSDSLVSENVTFARPNRKMSTLGGIYLPGVEPEPTVEVCCALDKSGSISDEMIREFVSEVMGIVEQYSSFKLKVWCFDTETYTVHEFDETNSDETYDFVTEGGGGTMFECNWDMMKREGIEPHQLIIFTDGYPCGSWGDETYQENLIFLICGDPTKSIISPIGTTLHYE